MGWTNYHTHCYYCDGKATPQSYVNTALKKNFVSLGFTSHFPLPFYNKWSMDEQSLRHYLKHIEQLKKQNGIEVHKGAEVDYIPGLITPAHHRVIECGFDYVIGSVHFVDCYADGTPFKVDDKHLNFLRGLREIFKYDVKYLVQRYYQLIRLMVCEATPAIVGHLDKVKVQNWDNQFFDEHATWYQNEVIETLESIKEENCILEVNTRGIYTKRSLEAYPSKWILELARQMDIPITLSSDAHHPDELASKFRETAKMLYTIGYDRLHIFNNYEWIPVPFNPLGIKSEAIRV